MSNSKKNRPKPSVDGLKVFDGKTPDEVRELLKVPKDFKITAFLGVPIEKIPYRYLLVFLAAAVYEARILRRRFEDAMGLGEEMKVTTPPAEESPKE